MKHQVRRIRNKVTDYKLCSNCNYINWYENRTCIMCNKSKFKEDGEDILKNLLELDKFLLLEV